MTFQEIITKLTELKLKFEPCYKLKAQDMDEIVDILLQLNSDNEYQQNIYSTDETIIGTYLGKTLYRKVFPVIVSNTINTTLTTNTTITNLLRCEYYSSSTIIGETVFEEHNLINIFTQSFDSGNHLLVNFGNTVSGKFNIILEYTKD